MMAAIYVALLWFYNAAKAIERDRQSGIDLILAFTLTS
jgi:uncharacterized membrane protein